MPSSRRLLVKSKVTSQPKAEPGPPIASEETFLTVLGLERKRTERSHRSFVLMLIEYHDEKMTQISEQVFAALWPKIRETDVCGWYRDQRVVGVIFTEVGAAGEGKAIARVLSEKVNLILAGALSPRQIENLKLSFHVFPEDADEGGPLDGVGSALYAHKTTSHILKRALDITGSLAALIVLAPLFALIALAIRATSPAPVLFRQTRLGQNGVPFTFLKFRSMQVANDASIHERYVKSLIAGDHGCNQAGNGQ